MALPDIFSKPVADEVIDRVNRLTPQTPAQWGKMNVAQMLAHCNVTYELVYDNIHPAPNAFMRFILKKLIKDKVVSEIPYKPNNPTAPQFKIAGEKKFEIEKERLISYIQKAQQEGRTIFDGKRSHSFGKLTANEWNNMFYKHLDHHLRQFGV